MRLLSEEEVKVKEIPLRVGGITPFTTIDFPGKLSAVLFCQGCPWRCRYCHNVELLPPRLPSQYSWNQIDEFLKKRKGFLDAVVFSGGEPTFQKGLFDAIKRVKELGFLVGLHTGGAYPRKLKPLLPFVDWVGFDIKTLPEGYEKITGVAGSGQKAWESLELLAASGVAYECRTTLHWDLIDVKNLRRLAKRLATLGVEHWSIQETRVKQCFDPELKPTQFMTVESMALFEELRGLFPSFVLRHEA